jgi:hypothetical protein
VSQGTLVKRCSKAGEFIWNVPVTHRDTIVLSNVNDSLEYDFVLGKHRLYHLDGNIMRVNPVGVRIFAFRSISLKEKIYMFHCALGHASTSKLCQALDAGLTGSWRITASQVRRAKLEDY